MRRVAWPHGLLVSVRDAAEAVVAVSAGAAIVDVKEPRRGPLGRPPAEIVAAVAVAVEQRAPLTLACGELTAGDEIAAHVADVLRLLPPGVRPPNAVKAGPAGLSLPAWRHAFGRLRDGLPLGIEAVAVAYADWRRAESPPPEALLAEAIAMNRSRPGARRRTPPACRWPSREGWPRPTWRKPSPAAPESWECGPPPATAAATAGLPTPGCERLLDLRAPRPPGRGRNPRE
jgi:hypothetical protein